MPSIKVTDREFEKLVLKSDKPVLVDFWAEWCGPCKTIGPVLEEISKERKDELVIAKINIDENPKTPGDYNVRGIPTMVLFNAGEAVATKVGAEPKTSLLQWLDNQVETLAE